MKTPRLSIIYLVLLMIFAAAPFVFSLNKANADAVVGQWYTEDKNARIQIYKVGDKYYGKIAWAKNPNDENGKPKLDKNNPNKSLRSRPIIGLQLLRDFKFAGKNTWEDGKIYDPESGKDYSCEITLLGPDKIEVRGYVGVSLLGRSQTWTRV